MVCTASRFRVVGEIAFLTGLKCFLYMLTLERCMCKRNIFPIVISRQTMHILTLKKSQPAAPVWCATLCGFWLIFEAGKYLLPGPTLCTYFSYYSACQCGPFLAGQYISFSVIVSVMVTVLVDKIVVGKCCFNLTFNKLILVATVRTTVTEPTNSPVLHASQLRSCGVSSPELNSPKFFF